MPTIFTHPKELLKSVDTELGVTDWVLIEQSRIQLFADATDDHQWIHVDADKSSTGPYGACIAHGYLTLSLANRFLPQLMQVENSTMGVNYGCEKVRFPNIVKVGQKLRGSGKIISVEEKPDSVQVVVRITMDVEGENRPVCVVDTISRFYFETDNQ